MRRMWICDSCGQPSVSIPWSCPGCGRETCEECFDRFGHCKECAAGKTDEELRVAANASGEFEFEPQQETANEPE